LAFQTGFVMAEMRSSAVGDRNIGWRWTFPRYGTVRREISMPAKSKAQQKAAGAALAAKRGDMPKEELQGASREMYESMSEDELEDFASTDRKDLPDKVDD